MKITTLLRHLVSKCAFCCLSCSHYSDRLPTYSASEALQNDFAEQQKPISTGLGSLDLILQGKDADGKLDNEAEGISRDEIIEVRFHLCLTSLSLKRMRYTVHPVSGRVHWGISLTIEVYIECPAHSHVDCRSLPMN